jgi:SAM-dependent methyltransferase
MSRGKVYDEIEARARSRAPEDFWGQVGRSVGGVPIDEAQIRLLIEAVTSGLQLTADDVLLDLCCGNGALSTRCFERCRGGVGVDFSDYLIEVAKKYFERPPTEVYILAEIGEFLRSAPDPLRFSKALCYGSFAYFARDRAVQLLSEIRERFTRIRRLLVGSIPDKARMHDFFYPESYVPGIEDDPESAIGLWWTIEEFVDFAKASGWRAEITRMPESYHTAHYRYDAVLTRT